MLDRPNLAAVRQPLDEGLISEAVRRVLQLPQYAGAEPEFVRAMVTYEINQGNITLYGVLRSVRRAA